MTPYLVIILGVFSLLALRLIKKSKITIIIISAIIVRLLLFITTPSLSEDPYRYLWDSKQIAQGKNPYQTAPALDAENQPFFEPIKDQMRPSIYFPLAQIIFLLAYLVKPLSFLGLKVLIILSDLLTILLLYFYRKDVLNLYLLSPLILIESYLGLHLDSFLIPLTLGFIIFERKKPLVSSILLATSILIKPTLIVIAPIFFYRHHRWQELAPFMISTALLIPYFFNTPSALQAYLRHWEFNASIYYLVKLLIINHSLYARIISYSVFIIVYPFLIKRDDAYPMTLGFFFLCSPTVYPWYLLPLFMMSIIIENPFLILCYTSLLSYTVLIPYWQAGLWQENWLAVLLEYLPVYLLMIRHFSVLERFVPSIFKK